MLQEKIARSLIPHATSLASSPFGRFFASKLKLHLLIRRPNEWKQEVIGVKHHFAHQFEAQRAAAKPARVGEDGEGGKIKRKVDGEEDEIDTLFAEVKKSKKVKTSTE